SERGVGVERVGGNLTTGASRVVVEKVCCPDFEIVVGGVGEGAPPVAIPQRPDGGDIGAQVIGDLDVAAGVGSDACLVEAEIVRVRPTADREQQMGADDLRASSGILHRHRDLVALFCHSDNLAVDADVDIFVLQDFGNGAGAI